MVNEISKKAAGCADSAVSLLKDLISHKSVMDTPAEGMPYGKGCADCLKFAEKYLESEGFFVKNFDNHAVTAAFDERPAELGILCHLDVVPTDGQQWTSDPFNAEIRGGKLYGRGAIDDKGPAAAVITAMRIIKESGIPIKKNARLILGSNEENGSADMAYYTAEEPFPPMLFTPDGSFPVITVEKGMLRYEISGGYSDNGGIVSLTGGSVVNAVPEKAAAVIRGVSGGDILAAAAKTGIDRKHIALRGLDGDTLSVTFNGKGAHASTPALGINALAGLMKLISALPLSGELYEIVSKLSEIFPFGEYDGKGAGIKCSDDTSGELTLVLSLADCKNGGFSFKADCRFPVCGTSGDIISALDNITAQKGLKGTVLLSSEPHCADENSEMVRTLLSVYEDCTGEKGRCIAIGGGTYVHDTENGVAFGAEWSEENNMHGADEFITLDELRRDIEIYAEAIIRLCC